MEDIEIRAGSPTDFSAVAALRWSWVVDENAAVGALDRGAFVEQFSRWASAHAESHRLWVAARGDEVVGMAWLALTSRVPSPRSVVRVTGDIQSVYVRPELRNAGVGRRLIDAVLAEAATAGAERVVVHSSAGAISAYERAGFRSSELLLDQPLHE